MDPTTLLAGMDFSRARLLGLLSTIEQSGQNMGQVLAWRPGRGRAHIGWQAMHCAATHDRYCNVRLRNAKAKDEALVANFAGGSTPSDTNVPTLADIRQKLESTYADAQSYVRGLSATDFDRVMDFPNNVKRTVGESIVLLIWHEAHHQGQMHLTWNLYKAAHGVK
jgi:hypothetical protein